MKLNRLFILVLVSFFIVFSSCKKDGPTTFTLQLKAKFGDQSFALNSANIDASGRYITLSTLKFYLSHINLIKSNGDSVNVASTAIFDFSQTGDLSVSVSNIQGDFSGISFACGLDSLTNDTTNPLYCSSSNPLNGEYNMYWPMIKYQFEVVEGKWDTAVIPIMRNTLLYHIGTNAAYRHTQLTKAFSVSGNPYNMVIYLDVSQIFNNTATGETINIADVSQQSSMSSSTDNPAVLPKFSDNFSKAFTF